MDQKKEIVEGRKLITVLYELIKEDFSLTDYTILEKLYEQIAIKASDTDFTGIYRDLAVWLACVLNLWHSNIFASSVKVLAVRLVGLVGSQPLGFTTIEYILPNIEELVSKPELQREECLIVPLLNELGLFLNHDDGLDWVFNSGVWKHVVKSFYEDRSINIHRSGVHFISLLLSRVNKERCLEILNVICEPIVDSCLMTVKPLPDLVQHDIAYIKKANNTTCVVYGKDDLQMKYISRTAKYLCEILDQLFSIGSDFPVKLKCQITIDPSSHNCPLFKDYQLFYELIVMLELFNAAYQLTVMMSCNMLFKIMCTGCEILSTRKQYNNLLDFILFCLRHIYHFKLKFPRICMIIECKQCLQLENYLFGGLIFFLQIHSSCFCQNSCFEIMSECSAMRMKYSVNGFWRKFWETKASEPSKLLYFQSGVHALLKSQKFAIFDVNRKYQSRELVKCIDSLLIHYRGTEKSTFRWSFLPLLSIAHQLLEKQTNPDFKDLFSLIRNILNTVENEQLITVSLLQLLTKIIKVHVAYSVYQLSEQKDLETLKQSVASIASPLVASLQNTSSWEIRDTALEVYQAAVEVGDTYPWLFCEIFNDNVFCEILKLAAQDSTAFVKSSALKFFATAMTTKHYADRLPSKYLSDFAIKTLLWDDMPGPRMAACNLLSAMYINNHLKEEGMPGKLFDAVYTSSMKELDWEVKKATLRFWQSTITKLLSDEGIPIDSLFFQSSSTLCNREEVVLKIMNVMDKLSTIGCLKVVWTDLVDDSEVLVSEVACDIVNNFIKLDQKWSYIDEVLINYSTDSHKAKVTNEKFYSKEDFFKNVSNKNWRDELAGRRNWVQNRCDDLNSLLEQILNIQSEDSSHNAIDCY